ncbi:Selenoprotein U [Aphelenchoides fujianensis]|nr:Selenoprotein U [Aphelenchoides fujianensis]
METEAPRGSRHCISYLQLLLFFCAFVVNTAIYAGLIKFQMDALAIALIVGGTIFCILFGVLLYANLPTRITLGNVKPSVEYLKQGKLRLTESGKHVMTNPLVPAEEIFKDGPVLLAIIRRPGCVFCRREASRLSELRGDLDARGIRLIGVVHETLGVVEFRPFFDGPIYFDEKKHFYGPNQRWLPLWMGFLRLSTYVNAYAAKKGGHKGNMVGEGRLLGGVYLIDHDQLLFAHLERTWGDAVDVGEVKKAVDQLPPIQTV